MAFTQLRHQKKLGYSGSNRKSLPTLSAASLQRAQGATLVSFRPPVTGSPDRVVRGLHGCSRAPRFPDGDLVLVGIETDSPLAPLLLWDIAHQLQVGRSITVLAESVRPHYLERAHFQRSLVAERDDEHGLVLRKVAPLPAETESGLDRWSFCIPVGPEDATHLNVVVKRVLELDVPTKEILLCGRPAKNFQYFDHVRIVGEDIPAPPVRISAKKNRLVQEAQYENLCIIHDRVFLPSDFSRAVQQFGDHFPFVAFQSIYFDDRFNAVPRRYSDFNLAPNVLAQSLRGLKRDNDVATMSPFTAPALPVTETQGYYYANPMRHSRAACLTGSLYLCKRSTWLACPQDERLYWTEFEDIDQGLRAESLGIPSRINPYAFTQSLSGRALLSQGGALQFETRSGLIKTFRSVLEPLPVPRKPLLKVSEDLPPQMLSKFAAQYTSRQLMPMASATAAVSSPLRIQAIAQTMQRVSFPIQRRAIKNMLAQFEKLVVIDQTPNAWNELMTRQIVEHGHIAVQAMVTQNSQLINHSCQRRRGDLFFKELTDYLPKRGLLVWLGSALSAVTLTWQHKRVFFLPGNVFSRFRAILDTTPYLGYEKAAQR